MGRKVSWQEGEDQLLIPGMGLDWVNGSPSFRDWSLASFLAFLGIFRRTILGTSGLRKLPVPKGRQSLIPIGRKEKAAKILGRFWLGPPVYSRRPLFGKKKTERSAGFAEVGGRGGFGKPSESPNDSPKFIGRSVGASSFLNFLGKIGGELPEKRGPFSTVFFSKKNFFTSFRIYPRVPL